MLPKLNASIELQKKTENIAKIKVFCSTVVKEIDADGDFKKVKLKNNENNQSWDLKVSGIFVHIGLDPQTDFLKGLIDLDTLGYINVNYNLETNISGIFAAGDIRSNSPRQAITAAGDGATAAIAAEKYIASEIL